MDGEGEKKQVRVTVLNQSFTLITTGDPREMEELANQVDDLMNSIARRSPNLDSTRVAVFAALHLADQIRIREEKLQSRIREIGAVLEDAIKAGEDADG